jgi:hypothetical protein
VQHLQLADSDFGLDDPVARSGEFLVVSSHHASVCAVDARPNRRHALHPVRHPKPLLDSRQQVEPPRQPISANVNCAAGGAPAQRQCEQPPPARSRTEGARSANQGWRSRGRPSEKPLWREPRASCVCEDRQDKSCRFWRLPSPPCWPCCLLSRSCPGEGSAISEGPERRANPDSLVPDWPVAVARADAAPSGSFESGPAPCFARNEFRRIMDGRARYGGALWDGLSPLQSGPLPLSVDGW